MKPISYSVGFSNAGLLNLSQGITSAVMPLMNQAVRAVAQQTALDWQEAVLKAKLWSGEKDAYAQSITWKMTGDFSATIATDYKNAAEIETGRPPRDLKRMLDTSLKVRRTDGGKRFLVIPMRHNTPGNNAHAKAMPSAVHALASAMAPSKVVGATARPSGEVTHLSPASGMSASALQKPYLTRTDTKTAQMVAKRHFAWGDRLTNAAMKQAGLDLATRKRFRGMVKMDATTPGRGKSSTFLTFRIMMEGSAGWVIPSQPGQYIVQKVASDMQPKALLAFTEAIKRTTGG